VGYALQLVTLLYLIHRGDGAIGSFAFRHRAPEWSSLYRDLGVMALGQIIFTLALPIDQAFAARLGPGSVAAYGYATRLITLATTLATVVFTRALLPVFSSAVAEGNSAVAARQARQWSYLLMGAGSALVGLVWLFAEPAVALVFQRGAFDHTDVQRVAHVLSFGVLQLPFVFAGMSLVQLIAARGMYSALLWIACGALALKVLLNTLLVHQFGLAGLMSATAVMYAFGLACEFAVSAKK
jgi:peptidoglycan biosynthesis protein MviN/MurJ (putative lipid II flippase)